MNKGLGTLGENEATRASRLRFLGATGLIGRTLIWPALSGLSWLLVRIYQDVYDSIRCSQTRLWRDLFFRGIAMHSIGRKKNRRRERARRQAVNRHRQKVIDADIAKALSSFF